MRSSRFAALAAITSVMLSSLGTPSLAGPCGTTCVFPEVRSGYGNTGTCVKLTLAGGVLSCGWLAEDPTPCSGDYTKTPQNGSCEGADSDVCERGTNSTSTIPKTEYLHSRVCVTSEVYNSSGQLIDITCACTFPLVATRQINVLKCKFCPYGD